MSIDRPMQKVWQEEWNSAVKRAPVGFVLLHIQPGQEEAVFEAVQEVEDCLEAYQLAGEYDLIVKFKCERVEEDAIRFIRSLRSISGVERSETLITSCL